MNISNYDVNSLYAWSAKDLKNLKPLYEVNDYFEHEGTKWYQLVIYDGRMGGWIEKHDDELWWENTPEWKNTRHSLLYTVHEKLYTFICLRWS